MKKIIKKILFTLMSLWYLLDFVLFKMRKIKRATNVFFFPYYHTGGAERVHVNILNAVASANNVVVFTKGSATKSFYTDFETHAFLIELNPILNKHNNWTNSKLLQLISKAITTSKKNKVIFGCNSDCFYKVLPLIKNKKLKKIDLFHAFEKNDSRIKSIVESAPLVTTRLAITQKAKQDIIAFYTVNAVPEYLVQNIQVIENGIALQNRHYVEKPEKPVKIGFIGRWSPEKRPEMYVSIAKACRSNNNNLEFVIAGSGLTAHRETIATATISFLGQIDDRQVINRLYQSLHFILIPSIYEGFPMVIMEAMSFGVIPIATNVGGISEHITSGVNGVLIDELTEENIEASFIKTVQELSENEIARTKLSENCFLYAKNHFGIDKFDKSYQTVFHT